MGMGGLFVVFVLEGSAGRFDEAAGRGGGGRLPACGAAPKLFPTPCWFKAAMRAESDVNCGSSTSAMVKVGCVRLGLGTAIEICLNECGRLSRPRRDCWLGNTAV